MQWSKPTMSDLRRERRAANFDIWDLTKAIYSEEELNFIEKHAKITMQEPKLQTDDLWWMTRTQRYTRACERAAIFVKIVRENKIPFEERTWLSLMLGEDLFLLLHNVMFAPTIMNQADDEQQSWWLEKAMNYEIFGTYAQTELTHGSNVRGLRTTATFDEKLYDGDGGWRVHTPALEAAKWWPGGLAKSCNCVILMARVIIKGKDYGPHPFFFQVRNWETHESLPGIELRDIGQKNWLQWHGQWLHANHRREDSAKASSDEVRQR
jgi:acyl-CoA oxidase